MQNVWERGASVRRTKISTPMCLFLVNRGTAVRPHLQTRAKERAVGTYLGSQAVLTLRKARHAGESGILEVKERKFVG